MNPGAHMCAPPTDKHGLRRACEKVIVIMTSFEESSAMALDIAAPEPKKQRCA